MIFVLGGAVWKESLGKKKTKNFTLNLKFNYSKGMVNGMFNFATLTLEVPEKTNFHSRIFWKIVLHTPLGNPNSITKTHENST